MHIIQHLANVIGATVTEQGGVFTIGDQVYDPFTNPAQAWVIRQYVDGREGITPGMTLEQIAAATGYVA
jgi:hypothetical protein